jgi:phosphonoacetaldehyde hydrolase
MANLGQRFDAILFDWAGTTIDFGSRAPVEVFQALFRRRGLELTDQQLRQPMGLAKDLHIAALLEIPQIRKDWEMRFGVDPGQREVSELYAEFLPLQKQVLQTRTKLIPGVAEAIQKLRTEGLRIGATTGYVRALMDVAEPLARAAGYAPEVNVCADEVSQGRPSPEMNLLALQRMGLKVPDRAIAVDDTPVGIQAGKAAGMLTIAVTLTGNSLGLDEAELEAMSAADQKLAHDQISESFRAAGADYSVRSVAEIPELLAAIAGQP